MPGTRSPVMDCSANDRNTVQLSLLSGDCRQEVVGQSCPSACTQMMPLRRKENKDNGWHHPDVENIDDSMVPNEKYRPLPSCDRDEKCSRSADSDRDMERGKWANRLEFFLAIVGYTVGVGSVWRFPIICR